VRDLVADPQAADQALEARPSRRRRRPIACRGISTAMQANQTMPIQQMPCGTAIGTCRVETDRACSASDLAGSGSA
jgi:hypothetical protein